MLRKHLSFWLLFFITSAFAQIPENTAKQIQTDVLLFDKISIRAITISKNIIYYAADANRYGYINMKTKARVEKKIVKDSLTLEFRSIAQTKKHFFILSVGNPALLYKIDKKTMSSELVYAEQHEKVFYDSMHFSDQMNGMAMGDPTENCLSVLITTDGGNTWQKQSCENAPQVVNGEAAFAASNTNLVLKNKNVWMVSGGKQSRVFRSTNFGTSWQSFNTPIVQGETMTGIFSMDFFDNNRGIVVGGNYDKPNQNFSNKAITADGGKTWQLVSENKSFGYASCVQYVPGFNGKRIVSLGVTGIYISYNGGIDWVQISDDKTLFTLKFIDKNHFIAAGKDKILKVTILQ